MVVRMHISIKTVRTCPCRDLLDLADLRKQIEVAVNGSQTDIRKFLPDILIDCLSGRMVISVGKEILNGLPLSAVL